MLDCKDIPHLPGIYRIFDNKKSYIGAAIDMKNRAWKHSSYLNRGVHHNEHLQRGYNLKKELFRIEVLKIIDSDDREILLDYETFYHREFDSINNGYNVDLPRKIHDKFTLNPKQISKANRKTCKKVMAFDRFTGILNKEFDSVSDAAREFGCPSSNVSKACKGGFNHICGHVFCYSEDYDKSKDYSFKFHYKKNTEISDEYKRKLIESNGKAKKAYVYDLNMNLISEHSSKRQCEIFYGYKSDKLRAYFNKDRSFDGKYFKSKINNK